ncbi:ER membrane protein complex subunit 10 [Pseudozyma hubeiensis]|nr:ER membrane protein complex subunit 10 [Pseudozyma hubeiensis]
MKTAFVSSLLAAASLAILPAAAATLDGAPSYSVLHRITTLDASSSSSPITSWTQRGTLEVSSFNTSFTNLLSASETKSLHDQAWQEKAGDLLYQLALVSSGAEMNEDTGLYTSVRLCHLQQTHRELPSIDDELLITLRSDSIVSLGYRIKDISLDHTNCPLPSDRKMSLVREERRKQRQRQLSRRRNSRSPATSPQQPTAEELKFNTAIKSVHSQKAAKLTLRTAQPTNEDGTVKVPPPEKSFVQKYWMYAIPVAILLIMPDGGDERDGGAEGHASSEHRGTGQGAKRLN